jgi:hypothetical protein
MMSILRPICASCIYWMVETNVRQATSGHCHRFPPHVFANPETATIVQKFPTTERTQWCGEWADDSDALVQKAHRSAVRHASAE